MKLAHLSDIHVLDLEGVRPWHFLNKRWTGGVNLLRGRGRLHQDSVIEAALEKTRVLECDHVAVTGDLTNLALPSEFKAARSLLEKHVRGPQALSVIPGNHDRYTLGSSLGKNFEGVFGDYLESDLPEIRRRGSAWPYVRLLDGVAVIGLNSAIPLPPFISGGRIGRRQRQTLKKLLAHPEVKRRFSVVLIHHHLFTPVTTSFDLPRCLFDAPALRSVLAEGEANLVLHGHNHFYGWHTIPYARGEGQVLICEAGSSSVSKFKEEKEAFGGKFNVYNVEEGALTHFDTYLYHPERGFDHWKRWDVDSNGPIERAVSA